MKGTESILLLLLLLSCTVVLLSVPHDVDATTTYVNGDWTISNRTTLSDGTWWVNGTIRVSANGVLRLIDAVLVIQTPTGSHTGFRVDSGGQFYSSGSEVRGEARALEMYLDGSAKLVDSRIYFGPDASNGGIYHPGSSLSLTNCTLEGGSNLLETFQNFVADSCTFSNFSVGIRMGGNGGIPIAAIQKRSWVIRGCTFVGDGDGIGVMLACYEEGDPANTSSDPPDLTIERCRFSNLTMAVSVDLFDGRSASILENIAEGCTYGLWLSYPLNKTEVFGNEWSASVTAMSVLIEAPDGPRVGGQWLSGGTVGLRVVSRTGTGQMAMYDSDIHGGEVGVQVEGARVLMSTCFVRAGTRECELSGHGWIHLVGCDHTRSGRVLEGDGEISDVVLTRFYTISWRDGPSISRCTVRFRHEMGYAGPPVDLDVPMFIWLPRWQVTRDWDLNITQLRAELAQGPIAFKSEPFCPGDEVWKLVLIDDFVPEAVVLQPVNGSLVAGRTPNCIGTVVEHGAGIASVLLRLDEGEWMNITVDQGGSWNASLGPLVDGSHALRLNVTDRAKNTRAIGPIGFEVDGTPPFIEIVSPGPCTRNATVRLIARTEVGSRVRVGDLDVPVGGSGAFGTDLQLFEGINSIHIEVIDRAGNVNGTTFFLELDVTPPFLRIDAPREGGVIPSTLVQVVGSTEENASVSVDGLATQSSGEVFSALLMLDDGEHLLTVVATDPAGNRAVRYVTVRVDTMVPMLAIEAPLDGTLTSLTRTLVTGVVEDAGDVTVSVLGQAAEVTQGRWSMPVVLGEGENVISVRAVDEAGNGVVRTVRVTLDTTPPFVTAELEMGESRLAPGGPAPVTGCATATLRLNFSEGGRLSITGVEATYVSAGNASFVLQLVHGMNWIVVRTSDDLGNIGPTFTFNVTRDDVPPPLGILSPKQGSRVEGPSATIKGTTEPGAVVLVNGTEVRVGANGTFTAILLPGPGHHSILVTSTDPYGNSVNATVKFDLVEPSKPERPGFRFTTGPGIAALFIGLLVLLVVLVARARARARTAAQRGSGGDSSGDAPEAPNGVGVRVRRGR